MKLFNNKSIRDIFKIGSGNIVGNIISSLYWIFLAGLIGAENYGILSYFLAIIGISTVVTMFGGQNTMQVYTAKNESVESSLYLISLISGFSFSIVLLLILENPGISISILGFTIMNFYFSELIGKKLFSQYSILYLLQKISFVISSLILYWMIGFDGILIGYGLSSLIFVKHIYKIFSKKEFNFQLIRKKKKILLSNYFSELTATGRNHIDKLIILPLFGSATLGNYFLSLQFFALMIIVPGIIEKFIISQDSRGISSKRIKILTIVFSIIVSIFGIIIGPEIIPQLFPQFIIAKSLIPIISLAIVPRTVSIIISSHLISNEKNYHVAIGNLLTFVALIIGILIQYENFNEMGLAYAFSFAMILNSIYLILFKNSNFKKIF